MKKYFKRESSFWTQYFNFLLSPGSSDFKQCLQQTLHLLFAIAPGHNVQKKKVNKVFVLKSSESTQRSN